MSIALALARWWRPLGALGFVLAAVITINRCSARAEQRGYDRAQAEYAAALARANEAATAREARQREISRQVDVRYQEQSRALQARVDDLSRRNLDLGRLRQRPACDAAPARASDAAAVFDGGAWDAGHAVPPAADPSGGLGVTLLQYGAECERYRQQLSELQRWVLSVSPAE